MDKEYQIWSFFALQKFMEDNVKKKNAVETDFYLEGLKNDCYVKY